MPSVEENQRFILLLLLLHTALGIALLVGVKHSYNFPKQKYPDVRLAEEDYSPVMENKSPFLLGIEYFLLVAVKGVGMFLAKLAGKIAAQVANEQMRIARESMHLTEGGETNVEVISRSNYDQITDVAQNPKDILYPGGIIPEEKVRLRPDDTPPVNGEKRKGRG